MNNNNKKILIVDDHPRFLELLELHLKNAGCDVDKANSARSAYDFLENHCYDLVITDYIMPEINGVALIKYLRTHYPSIPCIMCTSETSEIMLPDHIPLIQKPCDFSEIIASVQAILG